MAEAHRAQEPVPAPLPPPPNDDFMTKLQWDTFYALLDGVMPGFTSQSSLSAGSHDPHNYIALPDNEFEALVDRAVQALPESPPSRDGLRSFLEYRVAADANVRQDCLAVLARSAQRDKLAAVLHLLT